jgi:hypothetical protein
MTAWPLGHPHSSLQGPPGPVSCLRRPETLPSEKLWFCWREMVVRGGWGGKNFWEPLRTANHRPLVPRLSDRSAARHTGPLHFYSSEIESQASIAR